MATTRRLPEFHPFLPAAQQAIPPGLYDPALDATLGQAKRGFQDLVTQTATNAQRGVVDYGLGLDSINRGASRAAQDYGTQYQGLATSFGRAGEDLDTAREGVNRNFGRAQQDLGIARDDTNRSFARGFQDTGIQYGRANEDLGTQREQLGVSQTREGENYGMATEGLHRQYGQQAGQQRQQQNAFGVLRGGAALQAARKRAANEAYDRRPLDVNHQRAGEDFTMQGKLLDRQGARLSQDESLTRSRLTEDQQNAMMKLDLQGSRLSEDQKLAILGLDRQGQRLSEDAKTQYAALSTAATRSGEDADLARGNLALNFAPPDAANPLGGRSYQDMGTQLGIAARELGATGIDTERAKAWSAAQMGYVPPSTQGGQDQNGKFANEVTNPLTGGTTREYTINGIVYTVGKGGKIIRQRRA